MLLFAFRTADVLQIADRAVHIMIIRRAAVVTLSDHNIFIGMVNGNGDPFVEDVTLPVE
ncbi:hypothetical protein D3C81_762360 [compost metagenome]